MAQLLAFFLALLGLATATCYYPGGTVSSNSAVASCLSGATSMCCSLNRGNPFGGTGETDDRCLPNGLCQNAVSATTNGQSVLEIEYWRGSCNNIDWPTEGCIKVCDGGSVSTLFLL
ncbi:hypothetical protein N7510_007453 [Penicillium lagena]|uniref:uncharacterized protein n=1 Tax=Penicillium lagena TaxID=94218 RepID=UPI0025413A1E|nr:uncharacterized protein N7510_007453 [Penicillium lagena]KAJ5610734.1 hypothetical protein N7510_007453 [Penicillium lagena]